MRNRPVATKSRDAPSSMFLIRTERSTTSLSTLNSTSSDVVRLTIFVSGLLFKRERQCGWSLEMKEMGL